jgi:pyridoxamine-phosphate oxidase
MNINIANIRREYSKGGLNRSDVPDNPLLLFEQWLQEAIEAKADEPTAVIVGTVSPEGKPSTRTVLLKELCEGKFLFYTNYESRKGRHIAGNPNVSLTFVWHKLERQIHIEGEAVKVLPQISDHYFKTRPYKSRIGARISPQSQVIGSRGDIIQAFIREAVRYAGRDIERPEYWGGYAVTPVRMEFWQGRESRLHDRFLYTLESDKNWKIDRLAP